MNNFKIFSRIAVLVSIITVGALEAMWAYPEGYRRDEEVEKIQEAIEEQQDEVDNLQKKWDKILAEKDRYTPERFQELKERYEEEISINRADEDDYRQLLENLFQKRRNK